MTQLLAIEGTHCSGKSTLSAGIVADLSSRGVVTGHVPEVVRRNPLLIGLVLAKQPFTVESQIQLVGHQLLEEATAATSADLVVCDRSILNVLAYVRAQPSMLRSHDDAELVASLEQFAFSLSRRYRIIFHCRDRYPIPPSDRMRSGTESWQLTVAEKLAAVLDSAIPRVFDVPIGLSHSEKVEWCVARILTEVMNDGD